MKAVMGLCVSVCVCVYISALWDVFVVHKKAKHNETSFSYFVKSDACKHKICNKMRSTQHPHFIR